MPLRFVQGDLTLFEADVLVNAANSRLKEGGGVCGALFEAAGREKMREACDRIAYCLPGGAVITPAFDLPAKYVIHTVGPVFKDGRQGEAALLRKAYLSALRLAGEHGARSIAFPLISSGAFGYPRREALRIAVSAIRGFLYREEEEMDVSLVLYDRAHPLSGGEMSERLEEYLRLARDSEGTVPGEEETGTAFDLIDEINRQDWIESTRNRRDSTRMLKIPQRAARKDLVYDAFYEVSQEDMAPALGPISGGLDELLEKKDEPFHISMMKIIDRKGMKDSEVYKKANLDRKHFSKIKTVQGYLPGKGTVMALAVALELSREEAVAFLALAGYAFSPNKVSDIIIGFFIDRGQYDIDVINAHLYDHDQSVLGPDSAIGKAP